MEPNKSKTTDELLKVYSRLLETLNSESQTLAILKDEALTFYLLISAYLQPQLATTALNTLLYRFQTTTSFLRNFALNVKKVFNLTNDPQQDNFSFDANPSEIFDFDASTELVKRIQPHLTNIKLLTMDYFFKLLKIVEHFNRGMELGNQQRIKIDLIQVTDSFIKGMSDKDIFRKYYDLLKEVDYDNAFYDRYSDVQKLEERLMKLMGQEHEFSCRNSFSNNSNVLSEAFDIDPNNNPKMLFDDDNHNIKDFTESFLISSSLNIQKNEKFLKLFTYNNELFTTLKTFLTFPTVYPLSEKFLTYCDSADIELVKDTPMESNSTNNIESKVMGKSSLHLGSKKDSIISTFKKASKDDIKNKALYYRSFLVYSFFTTSGNHEYLMTIKPDYIDSLMESLYEGFKTCQTSLSISTFLLDYFLQKMPLKTLSLVLQYNFLFLFMEEVFRPKCFDFIINLISPSARIYGFEDSTLVNIWQYLKYSGFFQDLSDGMVNPDSVKNNIKFDKFFSNADLKNIYEHFSDNSYNNMHSEGIYLTIITQFLRSKKEFDPFLSNILYGIDNAVDFPKSESLSNAPKKKNPRRIKSKLGSKSLNSISSDLVEIKTEDPSEEVQKNFAKKRLEGKKNSLMQKTKIGSQEIQDYYYKVISNCNKIQLKKQAKKKKTRFMAVSSSRSNLSLKKSKSNINSQKQEKVTQPNKLHLVAADTISLDGYEGSIRIINLYPCFINTSSQRSTLILEDNEKFLKKMDLKKFNEIESSSYKYVSVLLFLLKDIYREHNILQNKLNNNGSKSFILWQAIFDFKNCGIFKDLLFTFIHKVDFIFNSSSPDNTSPIAAAKCIVMMVNFATQHPFGEQYSVRIKHLLRENFYFLQNKFVKMFKHFNNKVANGERKSINFQFKVVKDPLGVVRKSFIDVFFGIFEFNLTEIECFDSVDVKILQICFAWAFDKKHTTFLSKKILRMMRRLMELGIDKFTTEITLKLGFFDLIDNYLKTIFINDTLITTFDTSNTMLFIKEIVKIYIEMAKRQSEFPFIYDNLSKFLTFKNVCEVLYKIYRDTVFDVYFLNEQNTFTDRSVFGTKENKSINILNKVKRGSKVQKYFNEVNLDKSKVN